MFVGMAGVIGGAASGWWIVLEIFGALVALVGFIAGAASVRCPRCGARFFWRALRQLAFEEAMRSVLTATACPVCGSDGGRSRPMERDEPAA
jgi:DNA-directed RNA polymerase subunit RPC12/RpoP